MIKFWGEGERYIPFQCSIFWSFISEIVCNDRTNLSVTELKPGAPIVVTGGELQIELDMGERSAIRSTLIEHFQGRQKSVAELLRRSGVPMMAFDTVGDVVEQLRRLLGRGAIGGGIHG